jgi:hypothetical protein
VSARHGGPAIHVVVPVNNQAGAIGQVLAGLAEQTMPPDHVALVFDRCMDRSRAVADRALRRLPRHVEVSRLDSGLQGTDFLAGRVRDVGLSACAGWSGEGRYVLLDGDCVPDAGLVEAHVGVLDRSAAPVATCGLLKRGSAAPDKRTGLFAARPRRLLCPLMVRANLTTWSCNLGLNQAAVERLREVNRLLSGEPRVFHPAFDGAWGGEDDFVGATVFKAGGEIFYLGHAAFATHVDHPPRATARPLAKQRAVFEEQLRGLEQLLLEQRLQGAVTRIDRLTCPAGADSALEDLNFRSVEAPPETDGWLEATQFAQKVQRAMGIPGEIAVPLLKVLLARTRRYGAETACRCHALVERERAHGLSAARLREFLAQWVGPEV